MKIEVQESSDGSGYVLSLLMTRDQKAKIKALGNK
jgi:hypothetical protein